MQKRSHGIFSLFLSFIADKKFTRKPPRFSCLLPDPRELIEIKNKKKVHTYTYFPEFSLCPSAWMCFVGFLSQRMRMRGILAVQCAVF